MPLAAVLAVCLLPVSPALAAKPMPWFAMASSAVAQSEQPTTQTQQESQPGKSEPPAEENPQASPSTAAPEPNAQPQSAQPETPAGAGQTPAPSPEPKAKSPQRTPRKKKPSSAANSKTAGTARKKKPAAASTKPGAPSKVVVKNGSAADPTVKISPGLNQQQASSQRQGTTQLLANTDDNLKKISGRQLASNQQDMVQQIKQYMEQAKAATDAGDLDRAHNLALKANLLAQELVKP